MQFNFRITGIHEDAHKHLFELNKKELSAMGAVRRVVDENPGYPCRVSLEDAEIGDEVILFPYEHQNTPSPYQAKGPILIRKNAKQANLQINEVPKMLNHRLLSLRVYNVMGMMIDARTIEGKELKKEIEDIFNNNTVEYIHIHNASPGCYNCRINRA